MNTPPKYSPWSERRARIRTRAGQWLAGQDALFRKHSLLHDLMHRLSEMQLMVYGITGRIVSEHLAQWIEKSYFMTSYPDSRLWCNNIASLSAHSNASPVAATVAGFLAADSKAYGSYAAYRTAEAISDLFQQYESGKSLNDIVKDHAKGKRPPNIAGFIRPVNIQDERLEPIRRVTRDLSFDPGQYLRFAEDLSSEISKNYETGINAAGFYAAFLLDQGFTPQQIYLLCVRCTECGVLACYQENVNEIEKGFLPLQCDDIGYNGPEDRAVSRR